MRARSPLRWLSAVMSSLLLFGLAGILGQTWIIAGIPIVAGLFVLAPPLWVYRHDETPVKRTALALSAVPDAGEPGAFRLGVLNTGDVQAADFRIRLLVPYDIVPVDHQKRLLGRVMAGQLGRNWFVDGAGTATAITFRAAMNGEAAGVVCPPGGRLDLADLRLPPQGAPYDISLDYQVNGGSVAPSLDVLRLRS